MVQGQQIINHQVDGDTFAAPAAQIGFRLWQQMGSQIQPQENVT